MIRCGAQPFQSILSAVIASWVAVNAAAQPERWTVEEWREDLAFLHDRIQTAHKNPYHATTKEALDAAIAALHEEIPNQTDFQIAFAMQRIVASLGDGHSGLRFTREGQTTHFPYTSWMFEDGLYITNATEDHTSTIGTRIESIEGHSIDELMAAFEPYMNRDNDMSKLNRLPRLIRMPQALHTIGFTNDPDRATFQLIDQSGKSFEHTFTGIPYSDCVAWIESLSPPKDAPLYRTRNDERYWFTELEGHNTVYMQFASVQHREDRHLSRFARDLTDYIDENKIECLIIDIRMNGGGNGDIVNFFIRHIGKHEVINQQGHLYVITGRSTFSAALMFTIRMERRTNALFAGEPGAGKPNSYSESGPFELPNTGLNGSLSALFHQEGDPDDDRPWVDVDIPASIAYADYLAKRDPFLDAVLDHWTDVQAGEKPRGKKRRSRKR